MAQVHLTDFPEDLLARARRLAHATGMFLKAWIRDAVCEKVEREERKAIRDAVCEKVEREERKAAK
jgi:hypothetical protein